ncbi:MAG: hypothetical protein LUD68_08030, partial [Rikenellaceae bacterium]|nr:hypothetical protein [Rikenellaceae bacterium]
MNESNQLSFRDKYRNFYMVSPFSVFGIKGVTQLPAAYYPVTELSCPFTRSSSRLNLRMTRKPWK